MHANPGEIARIPARMRANPGDFAGISARMRANPGDFTGIPARMRSGGSGSGAPTSDLGPRTSDLGVQWGPPWGPGGSLGPL
jgi:hypothetical protein